VSNLCKHSWAICGNWICNDGLKTFRRVRKCFDRSGCANDWTGGIRNTWSRLAKACMPGVERHSSRCGVLLASAYRGISATMTGASAQLTMGAACQRINDCFSYILWGFPCYCSGGLSILLLSLPRSHMYTVTVQLRSLVSLFTNITHIHLPKTSFPLPGNSRR